MRNMHEQRGIALLTTLVLILVLALLSVAVSRNNVLEQRMSFNAQQHNLAYQQAESVFARVEAMLMDGDISEEDIGDTGIYAIRGGNDDLPSDFNLSDFSAWGSENSVAMIGEASIGGVVQEQRIGRYIIENKGLTGEPCLNASNCHHSAKPRERIWRVVVLGESDDDAGGNAYAHVILVGSAIVAE